MNGIITREVSIGFNCESIAFDGKNIWVLEQQPQNLLAMFDYDGNKITQITLPFDAMYICFDGSHIWVLRRIPNQLIQIDSAGNIIKTISQPLSTAKGVTFDGKNFWVVDDIDEIWQVDIFGNTLLRQTILDTIPFGIDFTNRFFWVGDEDIVGIAQFDFDGVRLGDFPLGFFPDDIIYDGRNIIAAKSSNQRLIFVE